MLKTVSNKKEGGPLNKLKRGLKITVILVCLAILLVLLGVVVILGTGGSGKLPDLPTDPPKSSASSKATEPRDDQDPQNSFHQAAKQEKEEKISIWDMITDALEGDKVKENQDVTFGVDVAKYQGTIDWPRVAESGVDFAMVRLGYRTQVSGEITEDTNARYNLQEAEKAGLKLGAYFFSTAITTAEAVEEADWVADFLAPYPITYPVAYNCEGFNDPQNRQYTLSKKARTDIALAFLKQIEKRGYEAMFYASKNEMENDAQWEVSRVEPDYKVWVAQYPENPYPQTPESSYSGTHHMWQYTRNGILPGILEGVDVNVAYFGYDGTEQSQSGETLPEAKADPEALMTFTEVNESVTAKEETNLRDIPSQGEDATVLYKLKNGQVARRIAVSDSGWSKVEFEGRIYYAVTSYLTTDLSAPTQPEPEEDDGIETEFTNLSETVTAKEWVNLRNIPSTTRADSAIIGQLKNGDTALRTGISDNGWSRLDIGGTTCYAVSSYLTTDLTGTATEPVSDEIRTEFRDIDDRVTAKDLVNLRNIPSTTRADSSIITQLKNGTVIRRTGINEELGWSRVEVEGQTLYCVTSYLEVVQ